MLSLTIYLVLQLVEILHESELKCISNRNVQERYNSGRKLNALTLKMPLDGAKFASRCNYAPEPIQSWRKLNGTCAYSCDGLFDFKFLAERVSEQDKKDRFQGSKEFCLLRF
jgi:hypothetical protein